MRIRIKFKAVSKEEYIESLVIDGKKITWDTTQIEDGVTTGIGVWIDDAYANGRMDEFRFAGTVQTICVCDPVKEEMRENVEVEEIAIIDDEQFYEMSVHQMRFFKKRLLKTSTREFELTEAEFFELTDMILANCHIQTFENALENNFSDAEYENVVRELTETSAIKQYAEQFYDAVTDYSGEREICVIDDILKNVKAAYYSVTNCDGIECVMLLTAEQAKQIQIGIENRISETTQDKMYTDTTGNSILSCEINDIRLESKY